VFRRGRPGDPRRTRRGPPLRRASQRSRGPRANALRNRDVQLLVEGPAAGRGHEGPQVARESARSEMSPAISVVLPVHNRADVLPRAIESVLGQTLEDFELVVVDDGSSDKSVELAKSFNDARIKLIELGQNRGGNAARNAG